MLSKLALTSISLLMGLSSVAAQTDTALYLIGKVVMDDGTTPPTTLRVELVCDSRAIRQSYPNEQGVFSFDLGSRRERQTATDATATPTTGGLNESFARDAWNPSGFQTQRGRVYLEECVVRLGRNPGFRGTEIKLGIRGVMDDPDIGELLAGRTVAVAGLLDASAPPKALQEFEAALEELSREKPNRNKARKHLEKAVRVHPRFAEAWALYGTRLLDEGRPREARNALLRAAETGPELTEPWLGLAQIALEAGNWEEVREMSVKALQIDPDSPRGLLYVGLAAYYRQRYPRSHAALGRLEELGLAEKYPISLLHLGMLYARMGDFPAAAERFSAYLAVERSPALSADRRESIERQLAEWMASGALP